MRHAPSPAITLSNEAVATFRQLVYDHFRAHGRRLPWRDTSAPYAILVSEIMLQQTQVERVIPRYRDFLAAFPDVASLARAPLQEVLAVWQGLGYNRRAVALHRLAQQVCADYGGIIPDRASELERLPGVGHYTARAIVAFAFNRPEVFIETNIRTVFIHHFFQDRDGIHDREILPLVTRTLDRDDPRTWYASLMDYGVFLKSLHPNPSRRSAHHTRQSPFKGSNRELRSRILRAILDGPVMTGGELAATLNAPPAQVLRNLERLEREGFLSRTDDRFAVRH